MFGIESFIIRCVFVAATLETTDKSSRLVILALIITTLRSRSIGLFLLFLLRSRLFLSLRFCASLLSLRGFLLSRSILLLLLLSLLVGRLLLLRLSLLHLRLILLVAAQEIGGALARLDLFLRLLLLSLAAGAFFLFFRADLGAALGASLG